MGGNLEAGAAQHGLDTGPVLARRVVPIAGNDDAGTLHDKLAELGADVPDVVAGVTKYQRRFGSVLQEQGVAPLHGMKVARMMAHITYVSEASLATKFGLERDTEGVAKRLTADFEVEHYLQHQGRSFLERFDALSYLYLTRPMDYFDPFALPREQSPSTRFRLISFDSDWRFPSSHSLRIRDELAARGVEVGHTEISSPWGHDSFLLEPPGYHAEIAAFLG